MSKPNPDSFASRINQKRGYIRYLEGVYLRPETLDAEIKRRSDEIEKHLAAIARIEETRKNAPALLAAAHKDLKDLIKANKAQQASKRGPTKATLLSQIAALEAQLKEIN